MTDLIGGRFSKYFEYFHFSTYFCILIHAPRNETEVSCEVNLKQNVTKLYKLAAPPVLSSTFEKKSILCFRFFAWGFYVKEIFLSLVKIAVKHFETKPDSKCMLKRANQKSSGR